VTSLEERAKEWWHKMDELDSAKAAWRTEPARDVDLGNGYGYGERKSDLHEGTTPKGNAINPTHYAILDPQPWDVITAWNLGYLDGSVIKYISRWRNKNGLEDLKKARAFLDHLISIEEAK
jgi:hypothetical protein